MENELTKETRRKLNQNTMLALAEGFKDTLGQPNWVEQLQTGDIIHLN